MAWSSTALALFFAATTAGAGGIYRYVDADGTIVYTNVPPTGAAAKGATKMAGDFHPAPRKLDAPPVAPRALPPPTSSPSTSAAPAAPGDQRSGRADGPVAPINVSPISLTQFDEMITEAALRYRIPPDLVRAVMHAESGFDPQALSAVGASGLMQLMPDTAREMYVKDIFDVRENIEGGVRYLRVLANEFDGDMVKMIAAYNAGPDAVRRYNGQVPPFPETQAYVRRVLQLYYQYKAQTAAAQAKAADAKR